MQRVLRDISRFFESMMLSGHFEENFFELYSSRNVTDFPVPTRVILPWKTELFLLVFRPRTDGSIFLDVAENDGYIFFCKVSFNVFLLFMKVFL